MSRKRLLLLQTLCIIITFSTVVVKENRAIIPKFYAGLFLFYTKVTKGDCSKGKEMIHLDYLIRNRGVMHVHTVERTGIIL